MSRNRTFGMMVAALALAGSAMLSTPSVQAQSAAEAAQDLAHMLDSAGGALSGDTLLHALEGAAAAGEPTALWQLGMMYESGTGVVRDPVRAFGYFSQIADLYAEAPPRGLDADIVAQSFLKVGEYYRNGLPAAGVPVDNTHARALIIHAASYFGDADAQYQVGQLYLDANELGVDPIQGARWLALSARKGHPRAQLRLGQLLFWGEGIVPQPVEGLMWMAIAEYTAGAASDITWVSERAAPMRAAADPADLEAALQAASAYAPQIAAGAFNP